MIHRVLPTAVTLGMLGFVMLVAGAAMDLPLLAAMGPLLFLVGVGLAAGIGHVAYTKERYVFFQDHLRAYHGGPLSDSVLELDIRNITHVKLRLPWLRHKLFRVGDVYVESAGSGGTEVALRSIIEPEEAYAELRALMQQNGYALRQGELLHEEQPAPIGVAVECVGIAAVAFITISTTLGGVVADSALPAQLSWIGWFGTALAPFIVIAAVSGLVLHYLDLRRRTYRVFDDMVVYEEGFLTRDNAFIPFENIADSNTRRTFVDQILGLYDVHVSCQGSGQEIRFRRLARGVHLSGAIDRLIAAAQAAPRPGRSNAQANDTEHAAPPSAERPPRVAPELAWTATLKMNLMRSAAPLMLLMPLVIPWIVAMMAVAIRVSMTTFEVKPGSVKSTYKFLSTIEREFTYDKITGVVFIVTPWDRLFGTVTVQLWSIGAPLPLELSHVRRAELNEAALLAQLGVPASRPTVTYAPEFGPLVALQANLVPMGLFALVLLALVILAAAQEPGLGVLAVVLVFLAVIHALYSALKYGRERLTLHERHVEAQTGLILRKHYRAAYADIKKTQLTRYPGSTQGTARLFVAGERMVAQQRGQTSGGATVPYSFSMRYLTHIDTKKVSLDGHLAGRPDTHADAVILRAKPSVFAAVVRLLIGSLIFFPLLLALPITLPLTVLAARRREFQIAGARVLVQEGILYRRQTTVLFSRIDSLRKDQGPLHKMLACGRVVLMTAGSSRPDLSLNDAPQFAALYDEIRRRYGASA